MATTFKTLTSQDVASTRNMLHEAIPLTGAIVSGTYADNNIKNFSHGIFQAVYDYPFLSSSANHILDITCGYAPVSFGAPDYGLSASAPQTTTKATTATYRVQQSKKINMYNQMAAQLMGYDANGKIRPFDRDGDVAGGTKHNEVFFLNFSRLLVKDEIKKGSFSLELGTSGSFDKVHESRITVADTGAASKFFINSPAGEYGILYAANSTAANSFGANPIDPDVLDAAGLAANLNKVGLIFYQAGIAVITGSVLTYADTADPVTSGGILSGSTVVADLMKYHKPGDGVYPQRFDQLLTGSTMEGVANAIRHRIYNINFNNTTELNSSVYFCRASHNEFNYSSNTTYLTGSQIRVKETVTDAPRSYITTVGLYSADNELLAVAKLSEPLKKDPSNEVTLRVRLDY